MKQPYNCIQIVSSIERLGSHVVKSLLVIREPSQQQVGFTLMELIVTISIAGILVNIAIPSFISIIKNNRMSTQVNEFTTSLNFARSEAIKRGIPVTLCKSKDGSTCVADKTVSNWAQGWIIFTNENNNNVYDSATETLLKVQETAQGQITIIGNSKVADRITYGADGQSFQTGSIYFCDDRVREVGKKIAIIGVGRSRIDTYQCT
jgi:type IV fimbrial biogenesis protein FimT